MSAHNNNDTTTTAATKKILVFGGTGPAGICLLRELLHRNHATIAYVRNPSKIPGDLAKNPLLEVIKGELTDTPSLTTAVSKSSSVISLVGPNTIFLTPSVFASFYERLFVLMRQHGVRRIFAMGTISIPNANDKFSLLRWFMVLSVMIVANSAYRSIRAVERAFLAAPEGVEWTVFRIAGIPGGSDEESWRRDREEGGGVAFEGWIGEKGWWMTQRRGALARWLVDAVEDGRERWVGKMPAVSAMAGGGKAKTT